MLLPVIKVRKFPDDGVSLKRWLREAASRAKTPLTILRPVNRARFQFILSSRLARRMVVTLPGHNPSFQILSVGDLRRPYAAPLTGRCRAVVTSRLIRLSRCVLCCGLPGVMGFPCHALYSGPAWKPKRSIICAIHDCFE